MNTVLLALIVILTFAVLMAMTKTRRKEFERGWDAGYKYSHAELLAELGRTLSEDLEDWTLAKEEEDEKEP